MADRNFDDIAEKFSRNIYGTTKGDLRQAILWQDLDRLLATMPSTLQVLDAGGGAGQTALRMAELGHQVSLCDVSAEMIARAKDHAECQGLGQRMAFYHSPAQDMYQHLAKPVDLLLFHAVLEWVSSPREVLASLWQCVKPGGSLSLMFYNANGLVMRNMIVGNFDYVLQGMNKKKKKTLSPDNPLEPQQVYDWLEEAGWVISGKTGVRVFHDYLRDKTQPQRRYEDLLALETRYCRQEPYLSLGRYIHVTAYKPQSQG